METVTLCRKYEEVDMPFALVSVKQAYFNFPLAIGEQMRLIIDKAGIKDNGFTNGLDGI